LLNVIRNVVVLHEGGVVTMAMLPAGLASEGHPLGPAHDPCAEMNAGLTLAQIERKVIEGTIARFGGSVPMAARELDISPSTIYRKLDGWGVKRLS
jgi:DNA-binding NtrC family response regulator